MPVAMSGKMHFWLCFEEFCCQQLVALQGALLELPNGSGAAASDNMHLACVVKDSVPSS